MPLDAVLLLCLLNWALSWSHNVAAHGVRLWGTAGLCAGLGWFLSPLPSCRKRIDFDPDPDLDSKAMFTRVLRHL